MLSHLWRLVLYELAMIHIKENICDCVSHGKAYGLAGFGVGNFIYIISLNPHNRRYDGGKVTMLNKVPSGRRCNEPISQMRKFNSEAWSGWVKITHLTGVLAFSYDPCFTAFHTPPTSCSVCLDERWRN